MSETSSTAIPNFTTKGELFSYLVKNKDLLIAEKKSVTKFTDAVSHWIGLEDAHGEVQKAGTTKAPPVVGDSLECQLVINTTNILDSHGDVHIDGLWTKTMSEKRELYLLQEHMIRFQGVISDEVKASTKRMTWKELGFDFEGNTQALIFKTIIRKARNEYMFGQYAQGFVKNHSVGMQYVKIVLCLDSDAEGYESYKANWDKYIGKVANAEAAEDRGYFWAVLEAKLVEGSAVLIGSNYATPVLETQETNKNIEPSDDTQKGEPLNSTRKTTTISYLLNH